MQVLIRLRRNQCSWPIQPELGREHRESKVARLFIGYWNNNLQQWNGNLVVKKGRIRYAVISLEQVKTLSMCKRKIVYARIKRKKQLEKGSLSELPKKLAQNTFLLIL